jgi:hypothetical protein
MKPCEQVRNRWECTSRRTVSGRVVQLVGELLLACVILPGAFPQRAVPDQSGAQAEDGYIGSRACAKCHPSIYESFSRTDMGRSMSEATGELLARIPQTASVAAPGLNRRYEVYTKDGKLYQSEFAATAAGKEVFRETHKLDYLIGSGANGMGAIVKQGVYLFEAPLSFYAKPGQWALSPGYEFGDYGFNRPILTGCIACHSGRARVAGAESGRFQEPPFAELAIGCENCHGPGEAHVVAADTGSLPGSIVNPAKLSPWLTNNICMSCHQTGDARVLQPGKTIRDFRPGAPLHDTLSIFLVPFGQESTPKDDLLEHYLSMRLSRCYLNSGGRLTCISCHDPHVQPSHQEAPEYFRRKCLSCHTEKSCAVPVSLRQHKTPPDDCAGCHMPKRDVNVISHSVLTNHRILAEAEEPFPDIAFHLTTTQLPDLVNLTADPATSETLSPLVRLQAYAQVVLAHSEYRPRYWSLATQLKTSHPENVDVLEALADEAVQKHSAEGSSQAVQYLQEAIRHGATNPVTFEELAKLLAAANRDSEALDVLHKGIKLAPYDAELYRASIKILVARNEMRGACDVAAEGQRKFPQDDVLRALLPRCDNFLAPDKESK